MKARLLAALAAGLLVGAADPAPDMGEVAEPQVIPPGSRWRGGDGSVWEFKKGGALRFWHADGRESMRARYLIDRKASPSRLDLRYDHGLAFKVIFRAEGDRLVLCCSVKDYPTRFMAGANREPCLLTFKRLK